jgi:hypothetical protein
MISSFWQVVPCVSKKDPHDHQILQGQVTCSLIVPLSKRCSHNDGCGIFDLLGEITGFVCDKLQLRCRTTRIYKTKRMTADGECVPCFRQKKSELRKGDRITLFHLMKTFFFPSWQQLAATDIMRRIKRRAVKVRKSRG